MKNRFPVLAIALAGAISLYSSCSKDKNEPSPVDPSPVSSDVNYWITNGDGSKLLQQQPAALGFGTTANTNYNIEVDSTTTFQTVDGFGYTLTGSSAQLINNMPAAQKDALLNDLFSANGIGVSYIRISIGASDLSPSVFTYNDMPAGQTDPTLANFSLSQDLTHLVPVLQKILAINPSIKILGSPWTAPSWMKTNENSVGGSLKPANYGVYAQYFVKYIQAMKALGITVGAVTIQNEPQHGGNNPSMLMNAAEQATFIKSHLGPAFQSAGITTKIIVWDHNCDNPGYPIAILDDAAAKAFVDGSAFHLYAGDISALTTVHNAHPDKNVYFTEQWTSSTGGFGGDLSWHLKNVVIGSMRNWSKNALEWNLANDPNFGPHTPGGCDQCKGAITIDGANYTKNVAYYIIAHASKFVPTGSVRIGSSMVTSLPNVAFKRPDGKKVLIVLNDSGGARAFNIKYKGKWAAASLNNGAVGTYVW
ncbi:MAG: glucosylceramidase [Chitinophagaceae bacterium]|nr:MAG: glucosylceramidase [Chitinophagaceae bacterium]